MVPAFRGFCPYSLNTITMDGREQQRSHGSQLIIMGSTPAWSICIVSFRPANRAIDRASITTKQQFKGWADCLVGNALALDIYI